ncbi:hypothetical protein [Demequina activiva]|uniref:Uncharacterized protein n=1 Tax=Demequina activiva TaxID=1582364 RepID=A0A919Q474_9MICO|nr:hypothetical protein [Demequina activiva]GIG54902.1 hypothetical protein Dac01nite_16540 [Demequina activiva]
MSPLRLALVLATAVIVAGCSTSAPPAGPSPSVPAGLDAIPATPLPAERNGIEEMPSATVEAAILTAVDAQTSAEVSGALVRSTTREDGTVTQSPFSFTFAGTERAFDASATWSGATVALSGAGEELWIAADPAAASALGRPDAAGLCLASDDPLRAQWAWLGSGRAIVETLLGDAELGGAEVDDTGQSVTFQVLAGGAVVGTVEVSATGQPVPSRIELEDPSGAATVEFSRWSAPPAPIASGCDDLDTE